MLSSCSCLVNCLCFFWSCLLSKWKIMLFKRTSRYVVLHSRCLLLFMWNHKSHLLDWVKRVEFGISGGTSWRLKVPITKKRKSDLIHSTADVQWWLLLPSKLFTLLFYSWMLFACSGLLTRLCYYHNNYYIIEGFHFWFLKFLHVFRFKKKKKIKRLLFTLKRDQKRC